MKVLYIHNSSEIAGGNNVLLGFFPELQKENIKIYSLIPKSGPIESELEKLKVPYLILDIITPVVDGSKIDQILAFLYLLKYFFVNKFDIIHAQSPLSYRLASFLSFGLGVKKICHLHFPLTQNDNLKWAFRIIPDAIVTCAQSVTKSIIKLGMSNLIADRIFTIPNYVNTDLFMPRDKNFQLMKELELDINKMVVSIIGQISDRKGQYDFLLMAKKILKNFDNVNFLIIGDDLDPEKRYFKKLKYTIESLNLKNYVKLLGFRKNIWDFINISDVIVLPSYQEGLPLILLESSSCAKPIVAYDIDGVNEVVCDGYTGFLVPKGNISLLSCKVLSLLLDSKLRYTFGQNARKYVLKNYHISNYLKKILKLYDDLL